MTLTVLLVVTTCLMFGNASPLDRRFLLLFGHQYNNPADMSNEFAGSTGGGAASQSATQTGRPSSAGTGIPGDATVYLDQTHQHYHIASGGNAGYVQHAGNSGPEFASQSVSTGHGTDHLPGKCPWITCSPDCQDVDGVTGCVICKSTCATGSGSTSGSANSIGSGNGGGASASGSGTGIGINGGTGASQTGSVGTNGNSPFNVGGASLISGAGVVGTGTGTQSAGTGAQATGIGGLGLGTGSQVTGIGSQGTGTGVQATGIGGIGPGIGTQAGGSGSPGTGTQGAGNSATTCAPVPVNCPRGGFAIVNGCPECTALTTTTIPTTHAPRVTCKPIQCLAPCNKGVRIDPSTHCPVCVC